MTEKVSPIKYFLSGGFGGICTVVTGHPLDTIKVRLQTMPTPKPGEAPLFKGTYDCFLKTVRLEGFKGLYKGMAAPLAGVAPIFALSFLGFGVGKRLQQKDENQPLTNTNIFLAGAFSGICTAVIMAPGERIKCLLQVQMASTDPNRTHYKGPVDCVKALYRTGGLRSVFRGFGATLSRDVPASGLYYLTYEYLLKAMNHSGGIKDSVDMCKVIFAGGMAGISNWLVAMPSDVIKSRMQASQAVGNIKMRDVFAQLMKQEGPTALYKGLIPVMLRAFPANAACFLGFEFSMKFLNKVAPNL